MKDYDDLYDLKRTIKRGRIFSVADVQGLMLWGYNRSVHTIDIAIERREAEEMRQDGMYKKYQFIK